MREQWRHTRALGSTEDIGDWLKRKMSAIFVMDGDWLEKKRKGVSDEELIERSVNCFFSRPEGVDYLIKKEQKEHEEQSELEQ
jgi:hypothetical protein